MFLPLGTRSAGRGSFPRARGDVPLGPKAVKAMVNVFPAHAGMFRAPERVRALTVPFSPRTRGCSGKWDPGAGDGVVFPAHAGMFPTRPLVGFDRPRFPRARGDVPDILKPISLIDEFSPRTRGCSGYPQTCVADR